MKIKTTFINNNNLNLLWSYVFLVALLISNQVSKCQMDSDDNDEVGGSLLSLAAPASANIKGNANNNLFTNPIQDKLNKMDALANLIDQNGINCLMSFFLILKFIFYFSYRFII